MYPIDLSGKTVVVTGASRGIGRASAIALGKAGARVVVNFEHAVEEAGHVAEEIRKTGGTVLTMQADVSIEGDVKRLFDTAKKEFGSIDILVNNAGIMRNNLLLMTSTDEYEKIMHVNARGPFLCSRAALKHMIRQKSGKIINIASIVGVTGNKGQSAYSMSKAAVIALTQSTAREAAPFGVTVNAVAPGFIETDLVRDVPKAIRDELMRNIPLGRFGTAEDVAKVVLFLASSLSDYVNGHVLGVDGGEIL